MRYKAVGIGIFALLLLFGGAASAQPEGDWYEQCYGRDGPTLEEMETSHCVKVGDGEWRPAPSGRGPGMSFGFGEIVFFGILLSLVPGFVGAAVGSSAGLSTGAGFLIGIFGSWIGIIAMYLYGHSQKQSSVISRREPSEPSPANPDSTAERLRTLQDLFDQGLITQEEYTARRSAAIEGL